MNHATTAARPSASQITECFYSPSGHPCARIKCAAYKNESGEYVSYWSGKTLQQMQGEHGSDVQIVSFDWAVQEQENSHKTPVIEITEQQYEDALNCLPPANWVRKNGVHSFHMCEMWSGTISCIYVRRGTRFFSFRDTIRLTHDERAKRVTDFIAASYQADPVSWWNKELSTNEQKKLMADNLYSYQCTYFAQYPKSYQAELIAKMYAAHCANK